VKNQGTVVFFLTLIFVFDTLGYYSIHNEVYSIIKLQTCTVTSYFWFFLLQLELSYQNMIGMLFFQFPTPEQIPKKP